MDRFGSSRLRIVWALVCLLLAGLALGAIQGISEDGSQWVVFNTNIPLSSDAAGYAIENLSRLIYTLVPAAILLAGFIPLNDWIASGSKGERIKGLLVGSGLAFLHGLFLSQLAVLPVLCAFFKFFGSPFAKAVAQGAVTQGAQGAIPGAIQGVAQVATEVIASSPWHLVLQADLNGVILGLQLLLWASALSLLLKSNRGLGILLAYALAAVGKMMAYLGEWGPELQIPNFGIKGAVFLGHVLPAEVLPSDPLAWSALPLAIGGPLALAALLLLLPGKAPKGPAKRAKA